ncbi:MAG: glycosyltransferase family 9 protein [Bacteroidia bacterium]|nr:glycosyltransferase family 9 protein [Bacteroidia bacterium]MDW8302935.1 glycosyltransferase family 9 protein [Bacteroidia bacterium]
MRFLILRFSAIGDIVLTTPVIRLLRKKFPHATIDYATKTQYEICIRHNPYLDKIYTLSPKQSVFSFVQQLPKYDYVIDLHNNLRTFQIKFLISGKKFSFPKLNLKKWLYTNLKINLMPNIHIVDRYLSTLKYFDIQNDNQGLDFFIPQAVTKKIDCLYPALPRISIVLSGTYFTKKYPLHHIETLIEKLGEKVVLLGGQTESSEGNYLQERFGSQVLNLCGQLDLLESAAVVNRTEIVISNDTGLMHIAAALKKYVISLWGNTVPEFGMYPYQTEHVILENRNLSCRPCTKLGYSQCPKKHFKCMEEIKPQSIVNVVWNYQNKKRL